jgi:hypothetical protein
MHPYRLLNKEADACHVICHLLLNLYAWTETALTACYFSTRDTIARSPTLDLLRLKPYCSASNLAIGVPSKRGIFVAIRGAWRIKMGCARLEKAPCRCAALQE